MTEQFEGIKSTELKVGDKFMLHTSKNICEDLYEVISFDPNNYNKILYKSVDNSFMQTKLLEESENGDLFIELKFGNRSDGSHDELYLKKAA